MRNLLAELRRRRVFRGAGLYLIAAWLAIQVADIVFPRLGLPDWTVTLVVALALVGLPVAVALAWAFDLTTEGIRREAPAAAPVVGGRAAAWLSAKLNHAGGLSSVDPAALGRLQADAAAPQHPQEARTVAVRFGAGHFILGSILRLGDELEAEGRAEEAERWYRSIPQFQSDVFAALPLVTRAVRAAGG